MTNSITHLSGHEFQLGDAISITTMVPDNRWWRRVWYWMTFRRRPVRSITKEAVVGFVNSATLATFSEKP